MKNKDIQNISRKDTRTSRRKVSPFFKFLCFLLSIIALVLAGLLIVQLFCLDMLPMALLIPVCFVVILITLLIAIFAIFKCQKPFSKVIMTFLVLILAVGFGIANYYVYSLTNLFNEVTNLTDKISHNINVITHIDSGLTKLNQLDGKVLGVVQSLDPDGTQRCLSDIQSEGINVETIEYDNVINMVEDLIAGNVDGIILNETFEGDIHDAGYVNFGIIINRVYETVYYTDRSDVMESSLDAVDDITSDSFTILVSGNDSYGSLNSNARSDVNMLVTVNPQTGLILMTSLPRDTYISTACASDENCTDGALNKLTHTGLYGVETTDKTIEDLLGVTINYTVRVNFSSLVNLVDAVGGIDVYVEEGLEVDTFYANGTEGVSAGWNHLDGERALAYSRERYAYVEGDVQRVKNQQEVLRALINKIASPSVLVNFSDLVDACSGAFATNMPANQIRSFIRYQFAMMPEWTFENFTVVGESTTEYCSAQGDYASVVVPYKEYLEVASQKINAVLEGKSSSTVEDPDPANVSLYDEYSTGQEDTSQEPVYQEPIYQEPVYQDPVYEEPVYQEPVYEEPVYSDEYYYDSSQIYDGQMQY